MIHVIIPTLYGIRNPNYLPQVVNNLIKQLDACGEKYDVTVCGRKNELYDAFHNDRVIKKYLPGTDGIHALRAINEMFVKADPDDFVCLFHDDLFIDFDAWPRMFMDIQNNPGLKCGVLGVLSHTQSVIRYCGENLFQMAYTNGNLFMRAKNFFTIPEELAEECGDIDLCYEQMYNGRKNYMVGLPYRHYMTPYPVTFSYLPDYKATIGQCRGFLNKKWRERIPEGNWSKYI